ncbi:hypothetical protein SLE2022_339490 [Rubroshorea leprosula]
MEQRQPVAAAATVKMETVLSCLEKDMQQMTDTKASKNRRRFSDDQIRSLEFMFESETRPESEIKQELAKELGLQPRQVAIWFQNRRARSKTRQIERDYSILKENYESLLSRYESLKREHQSLHNQLQKLRSQLGKDHGNKFYETNPIENGNDTKHQTPHAMFQPKEKHSILKESNGNLLSSEDNRMGAEMRKDDWVVLKMIEATDVSLTSTRNWSSFESSFLDESSCSSNWWEHW